MDTSEMSTGTMLKKQQTYCVKYKNTLADIVLIRNLNTASALLVS